MLSDGRPLFSKGNIFHNNFSKHPIIQLHLIYMNIQFLIKKDLKSLISKFIQQLPDVTDIIDNLDSLISKDIASAGKRGRDMLNQMRAHLNTTIAKYTPKVIDSINKAGEMATDIHITILQIASYFYTYYTCTNSAT